MGTRINTRHRIFRCSLLLHPPTPTLVGNVTNPALFVWMCSYNQIPGFSVTVYKASAGGFCMSSHNNHVTCDRVQGVCRWVLYVQSQQPCHVWRCTRRLPVGSVCPVTTTMSRVTVYKASAGGFCMSSHNSHVTCDRVQGVCRWVLYVQSQQPCHVWPCTRRLPVGSVCPVTTTMSRVTVYKASAGGFCMSSHNNHVTCDRVQGVCRWVLYVQSQQPCHVWPCTRRLPVGSVCPVTTTMSRVTVYKASAGGFCMSSHNNHVTCDRVQGVCRWVLYVQSQQPCHVWPCTRRLPVGSVCPVTTAMSRVTVYKASAGGFCMSSHNNHVTCDRVQGVCRWVLYVQSQQPCHVWPCTRRLPVGSVCPVTTTMSRVTVYKASAGGFCMSSHNNHVTCDRVQGVCRWVLYVQSQQPCHVWRCTRRLPVGSVCPVTTAMSRVTVYKASAGGFCMSSHNNHVTCDGVQGVCRWVLYVQSQQPCHVWPCTRRLPVGSVCPVTTTMSRVTVYKASAGGFCMSSHNSHVTCDRVQGVCRWVLYVQSQQPCHVWPCTRRLPVGSVCPVTTAMSRVTVYKASAGGFCMSSHNNHVTCDRVQGVCRWVLYVQSQQPCHVWPCTRRLPVGSVCPVTTTMSRVTVYKASAGGFCMSSHNNHVTCDRVQGVCRWVLYVQSQQPCHVWPCTRRLPVGSVCPVTTTMSRVTVYKASAGGFCMSSHNNHVTCDRVQGVCRWVLYVQSQQPCHVWPCTRRLPVGSVCPVTTTMSRVTVYKASAGGFCMSSHNNHVTCDRVQGVCRWVLYVQSQQPCHVWPCTRRLPVGSVCPVTTTMSRVTVYKASAGGFCMSSHNNHVTCDGVQGVCRWVLYVQSQQPCHVWPCTRRLPVGSVCPVTTTMSRVTVYKASAGGFCMSSHNNHVTCDRVQGVCRWVLYVQSQQPCHVWPCTRRLPVGSVCPVTTTMSRVTVYKASAGGFCMSSHNNHVTCDRVQGVCRWVLYVQSQQPCHVWPCTRRLPVGSVCPVTTTMSRVTVYKASAGGFCMSSHNSHVTCDRVQGVCRWVLYVQSQQPCHVWPCTRRLPVGSVCPVTTAMSRVTVYKASAGGFCMSSHNNHVTCDRVQGVCRWVLYVQSQQPCHVWPCTRRLPVGSVCPVTTTMSRPKSAK